MASGSVSSARYIIGVTYSCPLLRPRWCSRTSGAPSKTPPTLPSFARNSVIVFVFQSFASVMSNSSRSQSRGRDQVDCHKGCTYEAQPRSRRIDSLTQDLMGSVGVPVEVSLDPPDVVALVVE